MQRNKGKFNSVGGKVEENENELYAAYRELQEETGITQNDIDLTEAEDIKKRWQEYTELYKKDMNDPDNHDGVITHLEPDILEYEGKWALGSITTNRVDVTEFQLSYFKC